MDIFEGSKFDDIFYQQKDNKLDENSPLYSTIHGIKGGTFDAVLLFLKTRGGRGSKNYKTYLENVFSLDEENMEELRIVYVAITRPKKILWIVVPRDDFEEWEKFTKNSE
jgi:superfamily I DNA/RNA helicase